MRYWALAPYYAIEQGKRREPAWLNAAIPGNIRARCPTRTMTCSPRRSWPKRSESTSARCGSGATRTPARRCCGQEASRATSGPRSRCGSGAASTPVVLSSPPRRRGMRNCRAWHKGSTLDFVRLDFTLNAGIVVARVSMSPLFVSQLIDALQTTWAKYVERAMPQEVQDGPAEGEGDTPADPG